jgi:hypothetical protein
MRCGAGTRRGLSIAMAVVLLAGVFSLVYAVSDYLSVFNTRYGTSGTQLNSCTLCHVGSPGNMVFNPYGAAFDSIGSHGSNPAGAFASIEGLDSDGDGYSNLAEIQARTFPGNASSHPTVSDSSPPIVITFTVPATSSSLTVPVTGFTASDNVAVTGYLITTTSTPPVAGAVGWNVTPPTTYSAASPGTLTLYAWAKDGAGNVSTPLSDNVTITLSVSLTVSKTGTGSGTVTSLPTGIDCGATCSASYSSGTSVTLTASPASGSTFAGWSGSGCTGTGTCTVTMDAVKSVSAAFTLNQNSLTVSKTGTGSGTVTSLPTGIDCGATCSASYSSGTSVTLTASPASGSTFAGWSGGSCGGTGTCIVIIDAVKSVSASFSLNQYAVTVSKTGTGSGTVTSLPTGIDCGATCSASYSPSSKITLTAAADISSYFAGWSLGSCAWNPTCTFTLNADTPISATFNPEGYPFTDVPSTHWAIAYINALYNHAITTGYGGTSEFKPDYEVTREQMAAFIIRASQVDQPAENYCDSGGYFTDVITSGWACRYIQRLYELNITTGYGGTNQYRPELIVTREQMAAFIIRVLEPEPSSNYCDSGSPFSDVPSTSWSCKYIKRLYEKGITTGYGGVNHYRPELNVTMAQMAAFIGRAFLGME